jgi:hypothetical protein
VTIDAKFINTFQASLENPNKDDVNSDIAILTLEKTVQNLTPVALPKEHTQLPDEGLLVGYGKNAKPGHHKKLAAQALHGLIDMGEWGIILSNLVVDMQNNPLINSGEQRKELRILLGKDVLDNTDSDITRATQGDSGGPLLITNESDGIHILGIMSANSKVFNAFASLVVKTPDGYLRSHKFDALLKAAG